jgi:hypothetical protein
VGWGIMCIVAAEFWYWYCSRAHAQRSGQDRTRVGCRWGGTLFTVPWKLLRLCLCPGCLVTRLYMFNI